MKSREPASFLTDESGQGAVEYILIIGLVVLFIIVALAFFRDEINAFIDKVKSWIEGSNPPDAASTG